MFVLVSSRIQEEQICSKKGMLLRTQHPDFMHSQGFYFKLALVWSLGLKAHEGQVCYSYHIPFSLTSSERNLHQVCSTM